MNFTKKQLPDALRGIREGQGLTVIDLAEKTGLSFRSIYNVENGEPVRLATVEKMAAALGFRLHSETSYKFHKISNKTK